MRKIVSLGMAVAFAILTITGLWAYVRPYAPATATIHTIFGFGFVLLALTHMSTNLKSLKRYSRHVPVLFGVGMTGLLLFGGAYFQKPPFDAIMNFGARHKSQSRQTIDAGQYERLEMDMSKDIMMTVDLLKGEFYWHPQMAIWVEDTSGNYLETMYVSKATAKGLFFGGRSKENYKEFDIKAADVSNGYRRVNALPVWSHKRGVQYGDGMYVPTSGQPLPDAITGATLIDNFQLVGSVEKSASFVVCLELNVAFDDNEFYSEYDFPDDSVFHNGTGQLGQPSILFHTVVDMHDGHDYYLMDMVGHGHRSGQTGEIYTDIEKLTTSLELVERIVVGIEEKP